MSPPRVPPLPDAPAHDAGVVRQATVPRAGLRLSVVVPCFNVGALAVEAVASLLRQTMPDLEVVAVDDGSTDDTLRQLLGLTDARLTVVTQVNRGLAAARNTGIRHARAALIGFCDGDDLWFPEKAARQLAVMDADPTVGLTFSHSAYLAESGAPTGQLLVSRCRQPTTRDLVRRNHIGNGSTAIVRRAAFAAAGLFDESLASCEDAEMWTRLSVRSPLVLRLVPEPLTGYRVRPSSQMHTFDTYIAGSRTYLDRYRDYVPGYRARDAERTYALHLRVLSRKAFSSGQIELSRAILGEALRHSPDIVVRDLRAFAMLGLHALALVLPRRVRRAPYEAGRRLLRGAYRRLVGAPAAHSPL
ncbi:MAG: glycosyltransferase family 2 protein [Deltaproteobacteria bacterium]|nr:glycosyltransferase family 2 protein [Deltaproteobacteria bacterium]